MKMETTMIRSGKRIEVVKGRLVAAISAVEDYQKAPSENAKAQIMRRISLALASAGDL